MTTVGIPQALLYYQCYPMWRTFFKEMGAEVVISPPTTQTILLDGSSRVVADTCLPVKVFLGHVLHLSTQCDCIFIPAVRSIKHKVYNCSKFLGLPDMTKAVLPEVPPILDIDIDANKGKGSLYKTLYRLGKIFTWDPLKIRRAALAAWQTYLSYQQIMSTQGLTPPRAISQITGATGYKPPMHPENQAGEQVTIAIVGHPYLLYDEYINHRLIHRLQQTNAKVLTPEMLTEEKMDRSITRLVGHARWTYEADVIGAGGHYLQSEADGVIGVMTFGCGPDSLMMNILHRHATRQRTASFMSLTIEEHTAEAGLITRLEAFLDMIQRKKRIRIAECV
ncbi:acyl-CoA dehydratase activase-related protein [Chloroflexota bacterium]